MLCLYLQAPFGVFRVFASGSFRPTASFITPSAAYGLILNAAGVDMRQAEGNTPMTLIRTGLPSVRLAIAAIEFPALHSIFQQLHNYPVGPMGKERAGDTKGSKYNIIPVRREFLSGIKAHICIDGNPELETWVSEGLAGKRPHAYGVPFLGDNNFLIDRFEPVYDLLPAYWYEMISEDEEGARDHVTRLTITIDRSDMSRTRSALFAPTKSKITEPPPKAWVEVNYS